MRIVQYRIYSKILNRIQVPEYIYAFERDKSIPVMAAKHVGKQFVISIDIKDFFHSIKQNELFILFRNYGFDEKPARTLSELCTYKAFVPQGAITSPKLSNVISANTFGPLIKAYCDGQGLTLTIYADDITVSTEKKQVSVSEIIHSLSDFVHRYGFRVNHKKTKVMRRHNRQYVCGVVVNEKTNLIKKERLKLRAMVHNLSLHGPENEALKTQATVDHFINVLRGRLNWFKQLNNVHGERLLVKFNVALNKYKDVIENQVVTTGLDVNVNTEETGDILNDVLPWEDVKVPQQQNEVSIPAA
jgi:RNA-directed DNA polymerase